MADWWFYITCSIVTMARWQPKWFQYLNDTCRTCKGKTTYRSELYFKVVSTYPLYPLFSRFNCVWVL